MTQKLKAATDRLIAKMAAVAEKIEGVQDITAIIGSILGTDEADEA